MVLVPEDRKTVGLVPTLSVAHNMVLASLRRYLNRFYLSPRKERESVEGELAYRRLNQLALQLLSRDGVLITSSCSHHMPAERLLHGLQQAARHVDRSLQLLEQGIQSRDHPIHPAMPETAYLKTFYVITSVLEDHL